MSEKDQSNPVGLGAIHEPIFLPEGADRNANQEDLALELNANTARSVNRVINRAIRWGGSVLLWAGLAVVVIRLMQLVLPQDWCWLSDANLKTIDHILLGLWGGLSAKFIYNNNGRNSK
jgi:hypothetical protein